MSSLTVDDLHFELRRSPRRKSVQITVDRAGELLLAAPDACPTRVIERFVRDKRFWIYKKLAEKEILANSAPTKRYVSGESFPYLGRGYRLLIVDEQEAPLKLEQGRFKLSRAAQRAGREQHVFLFEPVERKRLVVEVRNLLGLHAHECVHRSLRWRQVQEPARRRRFDYRAP